MEEIPVMAIVKLLDKQEHVTVMLKFHFIRNWVTLTVTNNTQEKIRFYQNEMIGILKLIFLAIIRSGKVFYSKI